MNRSHSDEVTAPTLPVNPRPVATNTYRRSVSLACSGSDLWCGALCSSVLASATARASTMNGISYRVSISGRALRSAVLDRGRLHVLPEGDSGSSHGSEPFDVLRLALRGHGDAETGRHQEIAVTDPLPWVRTLAHMEPSDVASGARLARHHAGGEILSSHKLVHRERHSLSSVLQQDRGSS